MAIKLIKNQKIDLTKKFNLEEAIIGLGWETNKYSGGYEFDLDASVFLLKDDKCIYDNDFIFYNNLKGRNKCIIHMGDNRQGHADENQEEDDEEIIISFNKIPEEINRMIVVVTIHDAEIRKQNFGQLTKAYVRLKTKEIEILEYEKELLRYDLPEDFSIEKTIIACELYKDRNNWNFKAVGSGFSGSLAELCIKYGLDVE